MHLSYIHSVYSLRIISKVKLFSPCFLKCGTTDHDLFYEISKALENNGHINNFLINR